MKKFALTGTAGYIAPRHLKAIKETGNILVASFDPHDSVGVLDQYFPHADYFNEYARFERHLVKLSKHDDSKIDFLSICSPNYLHDSQIRLGLNLGAKVICEKQIVLYPQNLDSLEELERKSGKKVYTIKINGDEIEFSEGFTELHTKVYQEILKGNGLGISDARSSIEAVHRIRFSKN